MLLTDDHPVVRAGLRALLVASGIDVLAEASDGAEAIAELDRLTATGTPPDVVLMDLQMGDGMDGVSATAAIRGRGCAPAVLILTTYDTDTDILRAVAPGESHQTLPFVRPGGEILLKIEGWPTVEAVLRHVDGIEAIGVDPAEVDPDHWRHVAHWMNAGEAPRPYTAGRHQAWLRRQEIAP